MRQRLSVNAQVGPLQSKVANLQTTTLFVHDLGGDKHTERQGKSIREENTHTAEGFQGQKVGEAESPQSFPSQPVGECGETTNVGAGVDHMANSRNESAVEIEDNSHLVNLVRPPMTELDLNVFSGGSRQLKEISKANKSTWKRIAKGEQKAGTQEDEQNKENVPVCGLKRMRDQEASKADLLIETERGLKNKCL